MHCVGSLWPGPSHKLIFTAVSQFILNVQCSLDFRGQSVFKEFNTHIFNLFYQYFATFGGSLDCLQEKYRSLINSHMCAPYESTEDRSNQLNGPIGSHRRPLDPHERHPLLLKIPLDSIHLTLRITCTALKIIRGPIKCRCWSYRKPFIFYLFPKVISCMFGVQIDWFAQSFQGIKDVMNVDPLFFLRWIAIILSPLGGEISSDLYRI